MQVGGAGDVFVVDGGEGIDEAGGEAAALCGASPAAACSPAMA